MQVVEPRLEPAAEESSGLTSHPRLLAGGDDNSMRWAARTRKGQGARNHRGTTLLDSGLRRNDDEERTKVSRHPDSPLSFR